MKDVSPAAPVARVAALDVDGTLIRGQSQVHLAAKLVRHRLVGPGLLLRVLWRFTLMRLGFPLDQFKSQQQVVAAFTGMPQDRLERIFDETVRERLIGTIRPGAFAEIERLRGLGCRIVLVSASLSPIIARLAERLGADGYVATEIMPSRDGTFSGLLDGKTVVGAEKLGRLTRFADAAYGRWELFTAYGDQHTDEPLLSAARHPVAVCPSRNLARLAKRRGWAVQRW